MADARAIVDAVVVATLLCGLNALKPLVADDPAYLMYAAQIAAHPTDPYGFDIAWYDAPRPANTVLAPPVFLYWLGLGFRLFGLKPVLLKQWCWPWCFVFAASLHALLRRFARGLERPLLWFIALSPAVLPSINLMLDVPALSLSLFCVAQFLIALDRDSWGRAAVAGLIAGLAMQAKYTALTLPVLMVLGTIARRPSAWRLGVVAAACAAVPFVAWEAFVAAKYGDSHFVYHLTHGGEAVTRRANLIGPLAILVGGVGGALLPLGLAARRAPAVCVLGFAAFVCAGFSVIAPETLAFGSTGVLVLVLMAAACWTARRPSGRFLAVWLLLEVAGYFALTPWPAARRVLATVVVGSLLFGWLAARTCHGGGRRRLVVGAAWFSAGLGLLFQFTDIENAAAEQSVAGEFARHIHEVIDDPAGIAAVERCFGMREFADERRFWPNSPVFAEYDWKDLRFVIDRDDAMPPEGATQVARYEAEGRMPFRTQPFYYGTKTPIRGRAGPFVSIRIYRVPPDASEKRR